MDYSDEEDELRSLQSASRTPNSNQLLNSSNVLLKRMCPVSVLVMITFIMLIIPIIKFIISIIYHGNCPIRPSIPNYIIASAIIEIIIWFLILKCYRLFENDVRNKIQNGKLTNTCLDACCCEKVMIIFGYLYLFSFWIITLILHVAIMIILTIVGSVLVFSVRRTVQFSNSSLATYCHPTLYNFTFTIIIVSDVVCPVAIIVLITFVACLMRP
ncbi:hypothetical protein I4U23_010947 [Adineta vaga]|nr:hypothetical protein I4U23_010947 [Adineta vaga]